MQWAAGEVRGRQRQRGRGDGEGELTQTAEGEGLMAVRKETSESVERAVQLARASAIECVNGWLGVGRSPSAAAAAVPPHPRRRAVAHPLIIEQPHHPTHSEPLIVHSHADAL